MELTHILTNNKVIMALMILVFIGIVRIIVFFRMKFRTGVIFSSILLLVFMSVVASFNFIFICFVFVGIYGIYEGFTGVQKSFYSHK